MLSAQDYNDLWSNTLGLPIQNIPCYYQYLQREVYFQDYLDLFCCPPGGNETFPRIHISRYQTVNIPNLPPDPTGAYTVIDPATGNVRLIVDYDFPYKGQLCQGRNIKYILIGEAPPPSGKYIYKDASGAYITAPLQAKGVNTQRLSTVDRLLLFAQHGYLLLDLFPFAIDFGIYKYLRGLPIEDSGLAVLITNLISKIQQLNCLGTNWDFCVVAPENTSIPVLEWLDIYNQGALLGRSTSHESDLLGSSDYIITRKDGKQVNKRNYTKNPSQNLWLLSHLSKRAKFAVSIGGTGPNQHLVNRAF